MLSATALHDLGLLESTAPLTDTIVTRDEIAREARRLAVLFWRTCRARGLGCADARLPQIALRAEPKEGITGLCNHGRGPSGVITVSAGHTTWGALVECLIHELCHALEPHAEQPDRPVELPVAA